MPHEAVFQYYVRDYGNSFASSVDNIGTAGRIPVPSSVPENDFLLLLRTTIIVPIK